MAIIKLTPSCKDYLWGGSRLRTDFGVQSDLDPLAEAWVLSCHPDGPSYLPDGTTLADYACLLYTSPCPRDVEESRMPSSA